jgi:Ni/Co efflux regulator RcnB
MRRLLLIVAAMAACLGPLSAAGVAAAGEHGPRGERGGHGGGPPPWAHGGGGRGDPGAGPGPGYYGGGRWARPPMGPPPEAYGPPPSRGVRRGGYLPPQARGGVVQDYGRYRLRPPPPGYGWVRSGRSLMLMDMGTGQVFDVIPD